MRDEEKKRKKKWGGSDGSVRGGGVFDPYLCFLSVVFSSISFKLKKIISIHKNSKNY